MVTIKLLDSTKLIEDACALLHQILIEQVNWNFLPDNPSQLRIEIRNNRPLLVDRFTNNAVWFGAFDDRKLVGCLRATFADENNKLEIEGYKNSGPIQKYLPANRNDCVELTRAVILKPHQGLGILRFLFLAAFKYCQTNQYSVCGASENNRVISLFKKIQFPLKKELAFKYEDQDSVSVNFYFADEKKLEVKNMILNLETYSNSRACV